MTRQLARLAAAAALFGLLAVPLATVEAYPIDNAFFYGTWARTDDPVASGLVSRTWMWGPEANTPAFFEEYADSPGLAREVQYFDKSRMEITHPDADPGSIWYVTNGLLVVELVSGQLQLGDSTFQAHHPARVNVAGDADDPTGPTYETIAGLLAAATRVDGSVIDERITQAGGILTDTSLAAWGVTSAYHVQVPGIDRQVASPFWAFMNSSGLVYNGSVYTTAPLFENPFYATGYPITEAYWARVKVAGTYKDVLLQCFERRCLTYTPGNPAGWQVEAGNVGQHYRYWRYFQIPAEVVPTVWVTSPPSGPDVTTTSTDFVQVPDMSLMINPQASGDLAITFSAEVISPAIMNVRALVDGQPLTLYGVDFGQIFDGGVRSYTFVADDVPAGPHGVSVEWSVWPSGTIAVGDRSLSVVASSPDGARGSVIGTTATDYVLGFSNPAWTTDSGLALDFLATTARSVAVTVSAVGWVAGDGWVELRVLVDGVQLGGTDGSIWAFSGNAERPCSFTFSGPVSAGQHHVEVQWTAVGNATATISDRTVVAVASPVEPGAGMLGAIGYTDMVNIVNPLVDVPVPGLAMTVETPAAGPLAITVSLDVYTFGGSAWIWVLVDGQPAGPSDVLFSRSEQGLSPSPTSFTFVTGSLNGGPHTIEVLSLFDVQGIFFDRSLTVVGWPGS